MSVIVVVAALIKKDGKYLIARRSTGDKNVLGKWEFPGGKVKEKESEEHAIEREIKEEFEMDIKAITFCDLNGLMDYEEEMLKFDLCPADIPLAEYVKESKK